jgi:hypothetical protein
VQTGRTIFPRYYFLFISLFLAGFSPVRDRLTSGCLSSLWQYIRERDPTLHFYLLKHYSLPPVVSFFTVLTWVSSFQLICTQSTRKDMPIQKRIVDIRSVLEERAPELPRGPYAPRASGFPEGESVVKKRKKGEEEAEVSEKQQVPINIETTTKPSSKKGKSKDSRTLQKAVGHVSHKRKHQKEQPAPWQCEFYVDGRPVNEDDSVWKSKDVRGGQIADALGSALLLPKDMKNWKGNDSKHMIENLKRDSVVVSFVLHPFFCYDNPSLLFTHYDDFFFIILLFFYYIFFFFFFFLGRPRGF